jgi:transcriptional regulator with XRE-family HTH domain
MKVSASKAILPLQAEDALQRLGQRINVARRARSWTQADLAAKAGVSLSTLAAIESGAPTVQIGFYLSVLHVIDALEGLEHIAVLGTDREAIELLTESLPLRVRG